MPDARPELLLDAATLASRVHALAAQITADYQGKPLTALVVLKGSFVFAADLLRGIDLPLSVEFIGLRSYGNGRDSSGAVEITLDVQNPLVGRHVLVVEDIVDTGTTIAYLMRNLATRGPASIKLACLLHKPARTVVPVTIDYLGFTIADRFVIGYGLDDAGLCRNLPYVAALPTRNAEG